MTTGTKVFLGVATVGVITGIAYKNGVDKLQFAIDGFEFLPNGSLVVRILVINPNRFFGYPVPRMIVNAFDDDNNFIGTIINNQLQYIPAYAQSYIYGFVSPDYGSLLSLLTGIIINEGMPSGLSFAGEIEVGPVNIPFDTNVPIGIGSPAIGLPEHIPVHEGTIFYTSWGYEQTNVDFYKVVSVANKFFTVEKLENISRDAGSFMSTYEMPGESTGEKFRGSYKEYPSGEIYYRIEGHAARVWDGTEKTASHYA